MGPVGCLSVCVRFLFVLALGTVLSMGCAAAPPLLEKGEVKPLLIASIETTQGRQGTQVVIQGSRPFSYNLSNHEKPPVVRVEIPHGEFGKLAPSMPVNRGVVQAIDLKGRGEQARIEIALERLVDYEVQKEENRLVLTFKDVPGAGRTRDGGDGPGPMATAGRPSQAVEQPDGSPTRAGPYGRMSDKSAAPVEGEGLRQSLEYVIGKLDVLDINVYKEADLSGMFRVSETGEIYYPLLGNIRIAGLTPRQAQQKLEAMLREGYLKQPQVYVSVKEYRSTEVLVLGAVEKPGAYQLAGGRMTLLEVLSMAGGVSAEGRGKSAIVLRPDEGGETKTITVDLERLLKEGDASQNVAVQPSDLVHVTKADTIIVYGEVKTPGVYPLESKGMTLLEALFKAGGFTQYAAPNRTRIMRAEQGTEKTIRVRVGEVIAKGERTKDVTLQPGDVIVVPEGYF